MEKIRKKSSEGELPRGVRVRRGAFKKPNNSSNWASGILLNALLSDQIFIIPRKMVEDFQWCGKGDVE